MRQFLALAAFPFCAVVLGGNGPIKVPVRVAGAAVAGFVVAWLLNSAAIGYFLAAEIEAAQDGVMLEKDFRPEGPNLFTGLVVFGWIAVVVGNVLGQAGARRARRAPRATFTPPPPSSDTGPPS